MKMFNKKKTLHLLTEALSYNSNKGTARSFKFFGTANMPGKQY
jgi:hypothetical protein